MPNMSYCRMQNTLSDLRDCYENWDDVNSTSEESARAGILKLAQNIVSDYGDSAEEE